MNHPVNDCEITKYTIVIDVLKREVRSCLIADLKRIIGGEIEISATLSNGDLLVTNEDGLLHHREHYFIFGDHYPPFAGNGVIVGRRDSSGIYSDCMSAIAEIAAQVKFFDHDGIAKIIAGHDSKL